MKTTTLPPPEKAEWLVKEFHRQNSSNADYTDDNAIKDAQKFCAQMMVSYNSTPTISEYWKAVKSEVENFS